ncbi:MAG: hypothetical protein JSS61_04550 [Verrucomicrobia bacterium]|nr:hypothetical protein [Verrucomicrobiota bacterium]
MKSEALIVTGEDLVHLFFRCKRRIALSALWCGLSVFAFLLLRPASYVAEASFQQAPKSSELAQQMKEAFQLLSPSAAEPSAAALITSRTLLGEVIERLGLQIRQHHSFFSFGKHDLFAFTDVRSFTEKDLRFYLKPLDEKSCDLFDEKKKRIGKVEIGIPFSLFDHTVFTLTRIPQSAYGKQVPFKMVPKSVVIDQVRRKLALGSGKKDKNLLTLSYQAQSPTLAASLLNELMRAYQRHMQRENEALCQAQRAYLGERQQQLTEELDTALVEHVSYLKEHAQVDGYMGLEQEMQLLSQPKNAYTAKLLEIDLELKRLEEDPIQAVAPSTLGLDLATAERLTAEYTHEKDTLEAQLRQLQFLRAHLFDPGFEISSLGAVFTDPVLHELIQKASAISLQIEDENNRSQREQERLKEALETQKRFLGQHLAQTIDLTGVRMGLLEEKLAGLRAATRLLLGAERGLLQTKLAEVNSKISTLPDKWRRENLLLLKKELGIRMVEGLSQLAESKNISQHLYQASSKPLDWAVPPLKPSGIHPLIGGLLAALFGALITYFYAFCRYLIRGFPLTLQQLKILGYRTCGTLSASSGTRLAELGTKDISSLREAANFLAPHRKVDRALVVGLVTGFYPDYSRSFAELLNMRGWKVLLIDYVFDGVVSSGVGLWQILQGETTELPIRKEGSVEFLPSGGTTCYAQEWAAHPLFLNMLERMKSHYDCILLRSRDPLPLADIQLISVQKETQREIAQYDPSKAAFIQIEEVF